MVEAGLFLHVQWLRLDCSYLFTGSGWIALTCSVVQAGLLLFTGSGWIALTCSVVQAGLFRLVKACSPYQLVDNTRAGITY